ncbi:related to monocarboxylate transporter [Lecanosticta acicola]|uniref:Related to monocarboxylate transporter n=1 Tax=Lecanosticta acicola TaxID=111012 RepID=A0AAI9E7K7_9PEZI|nr:related to monocarboxylate transporter [Lecanosticta acicola]
MTICYLLQTLRIESAIIVVLARPSDVLIEASAAHHWCLCNAKTRPFLYEGSPFLDFASGECHPGMGYFLPINYLPSIAEALGLNSTLGFLTTAFIKLAMVFGCIIVGALGDRFVITRPYSVSALSLPSPFLYPLD